MKSVYLMTLEELIKFREVLSKAPVTVGNTRQLERVEKLIAEKKGYVKVFKGQPGAGTGK